MQTIRSIVRWKSERQNIMNTTKGGTKNKMLSFAFDVSKQYTYQFNSVNQNLIKLILFPNIEAHEWLHTGTQNPC